MITSFAYLSGMTILSVRLDNARVLASQVGGQQRFADKMKMVDQLALCVYHRGIQMDTVRRHPRTLNEAFPRTAEYACAITAYRPLRSYFTLGALLRFLRLST
jgi:hypothetical protein